MIYVICVVSLLVQQVLTLGVPATPDIFWTINHLEGNKLYPEVGGLEWATLIEPSQIVNGYRGKALHLNKTGVKVDFPEEHGCLFDLTLCHEDGITIAMWLNVRNWPERYTPVFRSYGKGASDSGLALFEDSDGTTFSGKAVQPTGVTHFTSFETSIQTNQWNHLAVTWESDGNIKLFVNGSERTSLAKDTLKETSTSSDKVFTDNVSTDNVSLATLEFGSDFGDIILDEIGIWNKALTEFEIFAIKDHEYSYNISTKITTANPLNTIWTEGPSIPYKFWSMDAIEDRFSPDLGGSEVTVFLDPNTVAVDGYRGKALHLNYTELEDGSDTDGCIFNLSLCNVDGITVCMWLKILNWSNHSSSVFRFGNWESFEPGVALHEDSDGNNFSGIVTLPTGIQHTASFNKNNLPLNQWNHLAMTWESESNTKLYVNASEITSYTRAETGTPTVNITSASMKFGSENTNIILDEVGIWSKALREPEILAFKDMGLEILTTTASPRPTLATEMTTIKVEALADNMDHKNITSLDVPSVTLPFASQMNTGALIKENLPFVEDSTITLLLLSLPNLNFWSVQAMVAVTIGGVISFSVFMGSLVVCFCLLCRRRRKENMVTKYF
ncbi:unnamed protein product [Clavelina lepadiformis]|uniref:LamG-like jellyroll fold domain-containing protein n=1 Tax=Clavelina lepadiformis TaxID=159417 RepID=A0ABP0FY49_CLALP